ncbi:hypothetical protein LTR10_021790 [Elasticomyces elasticus]|uniref:Transcription factor domain-containing protein n=1 Tax=Exophiala sideris TaxID=1016849 RepID=A0ABR0J5Z8_9EURO|nr:hypothetical protein LTR10_021790 [Elasticomyces elasticus]KAK5028728.1 hypothetical protein LTS07_006107 [Exophiala sideris]KAK5035596.1 hypothetical protein LTR13_005725 [Exophiala sideris]KAK5057232.1 hypothetical protein LTR69_007271 [Exophiala sideris]KAK5181795.1 hypothetical protein LTR44_005995 [Eurotiomycetes sp. CCFEE 6388]
MKKTCQPSPPVRRARTLKKVSADKTSKLEEKLDGLVTLLRSAATQNTSGILNNTLINSSLEGLQSASQDTSSISTTTTSIYPGQYVRSGISAIGNGFPTSMYTPAPSTSSKSTPYSNNSLEPVLRPDLEPSPEEAELRLNTFRDDYVEYFPFIAISPSLTVHEMRQQRPILWMSIMTVTSPHSTEQILLSGEMRAIIGKEAFVQGTRNMDFLLAVLVYASWDRRFCFGKPVLISLVQLAIAIVYDLGLDKTSSEDPAMAVAYNLKGANKPPHISRVPTLEERRALLAVFMLSSNSTRTFGRGSAMRWTAYLNECLRMLETEKEFDSDATLVQLVKLRLISDRTRDLPGPSADGEVDLAAKVPTDFYLKSLEAHLRDFKSSIPSDLSNKTILLMELYMTDFSIHEVGLSQGAGILDWSENQRIECLWSCLNALKSWLEVYSGIPLAHYPGFSTMLYSNMIRCLIGLYRLAIFEHAGWDRSLIRNHIDIPLFLEQSEKNFAAVKDVVGLDIGGSDDTDFFTLMAARIRVIRGIWDLTGSSAMPSLAVPSADDLDLPDLPKEFSDDDWLRNFLMSPWSD